jgi:hypothetical protein
MHRTTTLQGVLLIGVLILVILGQASGASAGTDVWTSAGPEGGIILALAIDPATPFTLYAGTHGGVCKSKVGTSQQSIVARFGALVGRTCTYRGPGVS